MIVKCIKMAAKNFKARVRYSGASYIVTIPKKIARELEIELGDRIDIQIRKEGRLSKKT